MSRETITAYFEAINAERWEDFRALLTDDVIYQTTGARPRSGRDVVVDYFGGLFAAWREHDDRPVTFILDGDAAAVEVHFVGVSLKGLPIEFDAVDIFKFREGRIAFFQTWYDLGAVRKLLELEPA